MCSSRNWADEVAPEVPASEDTAAMAAGCGRRDTLSMRGSPRSRFPSKQSGRHGCGSFFFQEIAAGPTSKSGQREPFGGRNILFLLLFFPESQGREPASPFVHC